MKYNTVYHQENGFDFGIRIQVNKDHDLSEEELYDIYNMGDKIINILHLSKVKKDPEKIKWRKEIKEALIELFGNRKIRVEEIPNEYSQHPSYWHSPWLKVVTEIGTFKIGWRKRVIYLDWTETDCREHGETLFPEENTTKSQVGYSPNCKYIHCWSYQKAEEYINSIFQNINYKG